MSRVSLANPPIMGSPEWFKYVSDSIATFKPNPQPHKECKETRAIQFMIANTAQSTAANALSVSFDVKRVKYSIIARATGGYSTDVLLIRSSLTGDMIGCVSDVQGDITETQTHEFIYQTPRSFTNERLTAEIFNTPTVSSIAPTNFTGVITLILELSNY